MTIEEVMRTVDSYGASCRLHGLPVCLSQNVLRAEAQEMIERFAVQSADAAWELARGTTYEPSDFEKDNPDYAQPNRSEMF